MFKKGDTVVYNDIGGLNEIMPKWYPPKGTIGTVETVNGNSLLVHWRKGSTSADDRWNVAVDAVSKVENKAHASEIENMWLDEIYAGRKAYKEGKPFNIEKSRLWCCGWCDAQEEDMKEAKK